RPGVESGTHQGDGGADPPGGDDRPGGDPRPTAGGAIDEDRVAVPTAVGDRGRRRHADDAGTVEPGADALQLIRQTDAAGGCGADGALNRGNSFDLVDGAARVAGHDTLGDAIHKKIEVFEYDRPNKGCFTLWFD